MNPYEDCPVLESGHFLLRLVQESDAADLLACYSDPQAQPLFNADNCTGDFCMATTAQMSQCIAAWLSEYRQHGFVRWSVLDRSTARAVGTVEMFGDKGRWGILRVDLASAYEQEPLLDELFSLAATHFFALFDVDQMWTKAIPEATERVAALRKNGFRPAELKGREHYYAR